MLCEGRVRWIEAHTFCHLASTAAAIYIVKFPMYVLPTFLRLKALWKLEDIVFLNGFQLKPKYAI